MTGAPAGPGLRVAYLVSEYPALSHAFIETEVAALRALGVEVTTFSVRPSDPAGVLTARAAQEAAGTTVLQRAPLAGVTFGLLALVRRSPRALVRATALAVRSGPRTARARLKQLLYLGEALVLWRAMTRAGLRHVHVHFANNSADIARLTVALGSAVDGPDAGWTWTLSMHGPTEFEDQSAFDLPAKAASASSIACISDFCRSQLMRLLPATEWGKLAVVRMSVDSTRFSPAAEAEVAHRATGDVRPLRVLTVGRLVAEKGAPLLVEAVLRLAEAGTPVHLTVVGRGPLADSLAADVAARGLTEVVDLVGPVGQDDLPAMYRDVDVFCLPSFAEGLPVVLMEAMASGLPVVTTRIAGIPELVVDHETGLLVTPGRPDELGEALAELAHDPALRARLGRAGRAAVLERHDPGSTSRELRALLGAATPGGPSSAVDRHPGPTT